jgi:hypothetical protein
MVVMVKLRRQIKTLETEMITLKQSEAFDIIINMAGWDDYFKLTKEDCKVNPIN